MSVVLWCRRLWWVLPVLLAVHGVSILRFSASWRHWGWMLSTVQGATILASPVAAGIGAFVVIREWSPGIRTSLASLPRPARPVLDLFCALVLMALAAQAVWLGVGCLAATELGARPDGVTLPWQVLTGPAALAASIALGCLVGIARPRLLSAAVVAIGVFGYYILRGSWWRLPPLLLVEQPTASGGALRPRVSWLATEAGANLALAAALVAATMWLAHPAGRRPDSWMVIGVLGTAAAIVLSVVYATLPVPMYV